MNRVTAMLRGKAPQYRPRTRINHMTNDGALVSSRLLGTTLSCTAVGILGSVVPVNPPNGVATLDAGATVLQNYQEYSIDSGVLHYTPACGTTTPGTVWIGYYDNPEIIHDAYVGIPYSSLLALAKQSTYSVSGPVWMSLDLAIPSKRRRTKFSSDTNSPANRSEADLTTCGIFLIAVEGGPQAITAIGTMSLDYKARGYSLVNNLIAAV